MRIICIFALFSLIAAAPVTADVVRWIEAEKPIFTNFPANPFAPLNDAERAVLSGGAWIGAGDKRVAPLVAVYDVNVPAAGEFRFYARKFWKHGPYRVRFNDGPWIEVGSDVPLLDAAEIRQHVVANWTAVGTVKLNAGANRFRIESTANDGAIAFDCFLLTDGPFVARGLTRPGERLTSNEPGWFAWDPPADVAGSPLDLRTLNEPTAGSGGRIVARDGRFVHETTGKPVRFWGVNCGPDITRLDDRDLNQLAALLASRGVNFVRLHGAIFSQDAKTLGAVDLKQIANIQRTVRILKSHGIYSTLSIYFPLWLNLDASSGWPGYKNSTPFGLLFFDGKLEAMYRNWWRALLTTQDAEGNTLASEPAVLSVEMLNEDSLFFWTFQPRKTIPAPFSEVLEQRFGTWLVARYGSIDAARAKWGSIRVDGDDFTAGRVGVLEAGRLSDLRDEARARDTARFLYEVEDDFYTRTCAYLRDELGLRSLVSAGNWTTANDTYLTPIERAANFAGDFIDRHGYYAGKHDGRRSSSQVNEGDTFTDRSSLRFDPESPGADGPNAWNPALDTSFNELPTMISELEWTEPNRFRTEAPFLVAALGAQQDIDAVGFFAVNGPNWQATGPKFNLLSPVAMGQYPAAAMIYRLSLLDETPAVVDGVLNLEELLNLGGGLRGIDAKARFIGKYALKIGDSPTSRPVVDLSPYIDENTKTLRSATGQMTLDYGRGVMAIDAPRVKALTGFLGAAGSRSLGRVSIHSTMEYGAIAVIAMDGEPIERSRRLLVQVMSEQKNTGWRTSGSPVKKIESVGQAPVLVREFSGSITFESAWTAQRLDQNGAADGAALPASDVLTLQPTTVYYVLTRAAAAPLR